MEVKFRSRKLRRCYDRMADAIREWGPTVGRRYVQRIDAIIDADRVTNLYEIGTFDFHPLTGNRTDQFAVRLTGRMRLVLTVENDRTVIIEEVVDYHG